MTQEELRTQDKLSPSSYEDAFETTERASVKEMIMRFERSSVSSRSGSSESLIRSRELGSFSSITNPLQSHFQHLCPNTKAQDRNSNVSVNSLLSNISAVSCESSSSGFASDRKSDLVPHRTAPPPPCNVDNTDSSSDSKSPIPQEDEKKERRFSFITPNTSPVVLRRARQPPVIRKKSTVVSQNHASDTLWSYGVRLSDLEKLLRLKRSDLSDNEDEVKSVRAQFKTSAQSLDNDRSDSSTDSDTDNSSNCGQEVHVGNSDKADTLSTDHSTDTLINDDGSEEDSVSITSGASGEQSVTTSNYDNVSIKSISSLDMVPYQKYDSITVSSDEFGSEICHAPDTEFLTVSAVNEWCISKSSEPVLMQLETKKEKYRRRLSERVNELIHTESVYVNRLKHVVDNYLPQMSRPDIPSTLRGCKNDVFANIERIHRFHSQEFLPALRDCHGDLRKLGQCFRRFEPRFNMYVMYSRNNKRATRLVYEHKFFFQEKQLDLGDRLDLSSYLLEPVQRLPRYKLFLDDLVKTYINYDNERTDTESRISQISVDSDDTGGSNGEGSENEETPLESLRLAKTMIECVLTAVDGIMALENIRDCPPYLNLLNQGRLLRQDEFFAVDAARRRRHLVRVFLFDRLLLITLVYKKQLTVEYFVYKDHIPVDELGITAKEQNQYKFSIWYKRRDIRSYKLETRQSSVRQAWVEEITSLLWEQVMRKKEMLLQERNKRISMVSMTSQDSAASEEDSDKYNSLRGVPGEVRRTGGDKKVRRTTWYCD